MTNVNFAQSIEGEITYQVTLNSEKLIEKLKKDTLITAPFRFQKKEQIESSWPINFILLFNENEAIYKPEFDLDDLRDKQMGMNETGMVACDDFIYYTNLNLKEHFKQYFFLQQVVISTDTINWHLEKESKLIGKYLCYKATATLMEELPNLELFTNKIVAWYTDEIPVTYGIQNLNGLPGLTIALDIETSEGDLSYIATNIDLNSKEKKIIKKPTGKKITHHDYINIVRESGMY